MSTRHAIMTSALSQERYMSSRELSESRGVNGVAVSARAAVVMSKPKQNFLWWLQGQSLADGGLKRIASELLKMFPDRIGTARMHAIGLKPDKTYPGEIVSAVRTSLRRFPGLSVRTSQPAKGSALIAACVEIALHAQPGENGYSCPEAVRLQSVEEFLVDLCINPRIYFVEPGEALDASKTESILAIEANPEISPNEFRRAELIYFRDVIGALFEVKAAQESAARENFQLTAIGKRIWETLDFAIASRGMVVLDGLEGRGKTEAVKAWCEFHLGSARFVSLKGITSKTTAFREIAKALGVASSYTRTATEMQARIEDVLQRSKLMLVIDEAHFLFNQSRRMYSRPELLDWIDTAVCNPGVPIALVTTPQFIFCMTRAADQVDWNFRQFRRRVKRWVKLPAVNSETDIKAVARNVFKKASADMISKIIGYALLSKRDLSAIGDVAAEVRAQLGHDDLSQATAEQIRRAIFDFLVPSDKTFLEDMAAAQNAGRKSIQKAARALPEMATPEPRIDLPVPVAARDTRPADPAQINSLDRASAPAEFVQG